MITTDTECRRAFLKLFRKLVEQHNTIPISIENLSLEDLGLIEIYLKDYSIRPVSEFTSKDRCGAILIERIANAIEKGGEDMEEFIHFQNQNN